MTPIRHALLDLTPELSSGDLQELNLAKTKKVAAVWCRDWLLPRQPDWLFIIR